MLIFDEYNKMYSYECGEYLAEHDLYLVWFPARWCFFGRALPTSLTPFFTATILNLIIRCFRRKSCHLVRISWNELTAARLLPSAFRPIQCPDIFAYFPTRKAVRARNVSNQSHLCLGLDKLVLNWCLPVWTCRFREIGGLPFWKTSVTALLTQKCGFLAAQL